MSIDPGILTQFNKKDLFTLFSSCYLKISVIIDSLLKMAAFNVFVFFPAPMIESVPPKWTCQPIGGRLWTRLEILFKIRACLFKLTTSSLQEKAHAFTSTGVCILTGSHS